MQLHFDTQRLVPEHIETSIVGQAYKHVTDATQIQAIGCIGHVHAHTIHYDSTLVSAENAQYANIQPGVG